MGPIPDWYGEIYPAGPNDGFYTKLGEHSLAYVERNLSQLVITFDNLSGAGHEGYDKRAWASGFCSYNNWSHLGVFAQGPTWFRDDRLVDYLEKLRDDGFFERFDYVTLSGTSMGAYGALVFSRLYPGATVIAFSPQTTLDMEKVPWETRYGKGKKADWDIPGSDAAACIGSAGKVYVVYDPLERLDRKHAERLVGRNVVYLKGPGFGHKSALFLQRMEALKPILGEAVIGTLDGERFHKAVRRRGDFYLYRMNMEDHLRARGREHLIPVVQELFKARRRRKIRWAKRRAKRLAAKRASA